jgi:regulator of RNase E activity RraA
MDVAPGEMIHMDENGAVKFPAELAQTVLENARAFLDDEHKQLAKLREAHSVAEIMTAFTTYK